MLMRLAEKKDFPVLRQLWMESFNEEAGFCEKFFQVRTAPDRIALIEEGNEIVSALHMLPCFFRGAAGDDIKGCNLVGAATFKEHRGRKYMERLLMASLALMKERGELLCSLKPFLHDFYRKYGWESCCRMYKYIFPAGDVKSSCGAESTISLWKEQDGKLADKLNQLYEKYSRPVLLKRSRADWDFFLWDIFSGGGWVLTGDEGYCICVFEKNRVKIAESVFSDENALLAFINKVIAHTGTGDVELNTLVRLGTEWDKYMSSYGDFTMLRIIDLKALSGKIPAEAVKLELGVYQVEDLAAPWNTGRYIFSVYEGRLFIQESQEREEYKIDIGCLTGKIFSEANTIIFEGY